MSKLLDEKAKFLQLYRAPEHASNVSTVCQIMGISRQTYYNWLEKDEQFRKDMYEAKMEKCDDMEQVLMQRAYEKSDTALIYWLKYNHPKYRETPQIIQQFQGSIEVTPIEGQLKESI